MNKNKNKVLYFRCLFSEFKVSALCFTILCLISISDKATGKAIENLISIVL